jgi:hypothetical protein
MLPQLAVDVLALSRTLVRCEKDRFECMHFLQKLLPATRKRNKLFASTAGTEVLREFPVGLHDMGGISC